LGIEDMEIEARRKRPLLLKIISLFLIFAGLSAIYTGTRMVCGPVSENETAQNYIDHSTLLDKVSPFLINPLLIVAAIFLLVGKSIGVRLYLTYLILVTTLTTIHIGTTLVNGQLEALKVVSTSISLGLMVLIYVYLRKLNNSKTLE